jgi:cell division septum initiation protein DivIVA
MAETTAETNDVASQYSAQVASDLEQNLKEQERLSAEIEALQAQLAALQHNHSVLTNIQQALGTSAAAAVSAAESVTKVPAPRKKAATKASSGRQAKAQKPAAATTRKRAAKKPAKAPEPQPAAPKLVDLVRAHLSGQSEPRSAAEVAAALEQEQPERGIKVTVVRSTLEGLVARNQAQRTKQGSSVFYTSAGTAEPDAQADQADQVEQPTD